MKNVIHTSWLEIVDQVRTKIDVEEVNKRRERLSLHLDEWPASRFQTARSQGCIRQEFIENLDKSIRVSLVLFKGTMLAGIQDVPWKN